MEVLSRRLARAKAPRPDMYMVPEQSHVDDPTVAGQESQFSLPDVRSLVMTTV